MEKVRVGVVGVGALGRHHARLYKQCEMADLVGIYDRDAERARAVAAEIGCPAPFASMEELAATAEAVSVALPTDLHFAAVKRLLAMNRHVLVEKPITVRVAEATELVALAAAAGLVLGVGHVERYNPVLNTLQQVPGPPIYIEAQRLAPFPPPRPGLLPRGTEVSVVLDLMIHDIDVVLSLVNSGIARVDAVGVPILTPTVDIANARLVFENGCVANMTASRVSAEPMRKIRVFKPSAYLSLDYQTQTGETAWRNGMEIIRQKVPVNSANALLEELADFCRAILALRGGNSAAATRVSGEQGLAALKVAEMIEADIAATTR